MDEQWLTVGKIVNTHGLRGEVKVLSRTDFPEDRFKPGSKLAIAPEHGDVERSVTIESSRMNKSMFLLKLKEFNDINEAEKYKGSLLKVNKTEQSELGADEYYYHEIIGCRVVTDEAEELGTISEILSPGANDVWVVERPDHRKPLLIPVIDDVVLNVDIQDKLVKIHLMEGLI
ncbi:MAG: rRNA processing protein RimM [Paenibacillaceae bacterium]|jgi:16S rRNA processing protein RimM|nr:rRNA processing protein RimM [Paenibacillaceae bacterium]